jgi:4-aminobutyrate aminotransferase-like enzyme
MKLGFSLFFCFLVVMVSGLKLGQRAIASGFSKSQLASTTVEDYESNVMKTYGRYPMTISHGKGSRLYDLEGKEYLDMASGIATCCLGHAHPALQKAVSDQMGRINHCSNLYFIPEQGKLAKWLVANSCADKVGFPCFIFVYHSSMINVFQFLGFFLQLGRGSQ